MGFFVNGKLEEGLTMLYDMVKNGPSSNVKNFTIVVKGFCEGGKLVEEAIEVIETMTQQGINVDKFIYCTLLEGLCKIGKIKGVVQHFHQMGKATGFNDLVAYNILINGFCKMGDMERAYR